MHLVSCGTGRGDVTCRRGAQRSAMPIAESVVYTLLRAISTLACVLRLATLDAIARLGCRADSAHVAFAPILQRKVPRSFISSAHMTAGQPSATAASW